MPCAPCAQFAVYAAYRNRLETAFLADELASAIPTASEGVPSAGASAPSSPRKVASSAAPSPHAGSPAGSGGTPSLRSGPGTPARGSAPDQAAAPGGVDPAVAARVADTEGWQMARPPEDPQACTGDFPAGFCSGDGLALHITAQRPADPGRERCLAWL